MGNSNLMYPAILRGLPHAPYRHFKVKSGGRTYDFS